MGSGMSETKSQAQSILSAAIRDLLRSRCLMTRTDDLAGAILELLGPFLEETEALQELKVILDLEDDLIDVENLERLRTIIRNALGEY